MTSTEQAVTRLVLVRHGQAADVDGRCIGHTDVALSAHGAEAIRALAASSSRWTTNASIVSSDLARASDSARILGAALGVDVRLDPRLREMSFGEWDGRAWSEIQATDGPRSSAWMARWSELAPPGGESLTAVGARAKEWLDELRSRQIAADQTVIVVSHAGWIRTAVSILTDSPLDRIFSIPADYARATTLALSRGRCTLETLNATTLQVAVSSSPE
jgi:broad specificity phosphatase PhoE